jgi:uncharacterized protein (TIGR03435 family)
MLFCSAAFGQAVAQPAFEVASVRRGDSSMPGGYLRGGPGTTEPGQITGLNISLVSVLMRAYRVQFFQISGPDWLNSEKYDIAAKIPEGSQQQFDLMLRNLLAERFHLALHHETRYLPAYELVLTKNTPKLRESGPNTTPDEALPPALKQLSPAVRSMVLLGNPIMTRTRVLIAGRMKSLAWLAEMFQNMIFGGVPVLDTTGLTGKYDFTLEFERPGADPGGDPLPSIFTAVQEQLGLKLDEKKLPFDVVVVDHADKVPTDN